jgi:hypothetical protein
VIQSGVSAAEISMSISSTVAISELGDVFAQLTSCQRLLTARDVAKSLAISEKTVYSYLSRNLEIRCLKEEALPNEGMEPGIGVRKHE